ATGQNVGARASRPLRLRARRPRSDVLSGSSKPQAAQLFCDKPLLLRDKEGVNLVVGHRLGAAAGVDHQRATARRHPDDAIAEAEALAHLRLPFEDAEVGGAHGLDRNGLHLAVEGVVDPDAADLQAIATCRLTHGAAADLVLVAQLAEASRQIDARLAG